MFAFSFVCTISNAQTKYYKLTRKVINGQSSTNVSGGQFICFTKEGCYEADRKGFSVNNGTMKYKYTDNGISFYMGSCYWGTEAIFKFKSDLSVLNVVLKNGDVYVYKRQTAPSSVTTCSLIRKNGGSNSDGGSYIPTYPQNGYGGGYVPQIGSSSSSQRQDTNSPRKQPTKHTCSLCNGQKRIVKDTYPSLYGQNDYQVKCNECGGYFMRSTGHTHITCPQCHGKGYFTTD